MDFGRADTYLMSVRALRALPRFGRDARKERAAKRLSLEQVKRRRSELWTMSLFWVATLTVAVAIFSVGRDLLPDALRISSLENWVVLVLLAGLMIALLLYTAEKEASLRQLEQALLEEKIYSERLGQRLAETAELSKVGRAINTTLDLPVVLDLILDHALDLLGGQEASIMLLDRDGERLETMSYRGATTGVVGSTVALGEGIAGMAAEQLTPMLHAAPGPAAEGDGEPTRIVNSTMSSPLVRRDELLGVLNVSETSGSKHFEQHDLDALGFFAEHAAIAIGNARLFAKERDAVSRLEDLDRLKSDFLANVSHELRSPLASIIGSVRTIKRAGERMGPDDHGHFLEVIDRQGQRLLKMVEELLTSANVDSGRYKMRRVRVELESFIKEVVGDIKTSQIAAGREVGIELRTPDPVVWCDDRALNHILRNLIENAFKYSKEGRPVSITAEQHETEVIIEVIDRGQGIPEDQLHIIFDRFSQLDSSSTRQVGGVGLGLSIVKGLVDAHNGTIEVESEVGRGTTFRVRIPQRSGNREG